MFEIIVGFLTLLFLGRKPADREHTTLLPLIDADRSKNAGWFIEDDHDSCDDPDDDMESDETGGCDDIDDEFTE